MSETKLGKVSLTPKGAWDSATAYEQLDLVSYDGGSWVAKKPSTGVTPRENDCWMQAAERGATGEKGATGDASETTKAAYIVPRSTTSNIDFSARPMLPLHRGNKLAFVPPENVVIETTDDGGETWTVDTGYSKADKANIFVDGQQGACRIPWHSGEISDKYGARITIAVNNFNVPDGVTDADRMSYWTSDNFISNERYAQVDGLFLLFNGSGTAIVTLERKTLTGSWLTFASNVRCGGWVEESFIHFSQFRLGGAKTQGNYMFLRITFYRDTSSTYNTGPMNLINIHAVGKQFYKVPNPLGNWDHLYSVDYNQNATFPAKLYAEGGKYIEPDGEYKLIETITLSEDTATISRSAKPDGTAYAFRGMMIRTTFPATTLTGNISIWFNTAAGRSCRSFFINPRPTDDVVYGLTVIRPISGRWHTGWWGCVTGNGVFAPYYENPVSSLSESALYDITSFNTLGTIQSGTKLEIYAVE